MNEKQPAARINHEILFGPWRPMSEGERKRIDPNHIVHSGTKVKIPMVPTRLYPLPIINQKQ
ncbi:MAG: hypothetical protein A3C22_02295 [Candidatus Levybacteria bacterium RIFCSPHIGHO2_02_FULL_37_10]|nr:MAG: hypothetical protein A3C22_02295 [Candidatus Levybacteria bacterium RIFCSPHIGHO2_02_FULL_37_10]